jgi:hypothetical protein
VGRDNRSNNQGSNPQGSRARDSNPQDYDPQGIVSQLPRTFFEKPLHGVRLYSLGEATIHTAKTKGDAEHRMSLRVEAAEQPPQSNKNLLWSLSDKGLRYESLVQFYESQASLKQPAQLLTICCEGKGSFEYTSQGIKVHWQKEGTGPEHYFQSMGLAFWLEQRGIPCIHANALAVGDSAIGILAPSQTGKTTLTTALLRQALQDDGRNDVAMMSDDMMAIHHINNEYRVYPGWPLFRVWPDTAKTITDTNIKTLPRVHGRFDKRLINIERSSALAFCQTSRPLKQLYLLDRKISNENKSTEKVSIETVAPAAALVHLIQNSTLGGAYNALGVERERLEALARLLEAVPLRRVSFESGMEYLPEVSKTILADVS